MHNLDQIVDRRGTGSIKWDFQSGFGQQTGLLPFWIADMEFPTVPEVATALKERSDHGIIGYSRAMPSVYEAIRGWWQRRYRCDIHTDWMLLSYGVVTGIYFTLEALLQKNDKVLVFTPVYDPFFGAVKNSGCTLVDCPLHCEDAYYTIDWSRLEAELSNGVKAVLFCNPHNPVARVWTKEELQRLVDLCVQYDAYLLSDEIHADFGFVRPYTPMAAFPEIHDKLIVYTAISKTFNLAGMGSSCMFIPNADLKETIRAVYASRWMFGPDTLAVVAMEAAYQHGDAWLDEVLAYLSENAACVTTFIQENMPKVLVSPQEGTFLMWLDMRCFGMGSEQLSKLLASEYGIALGIGSHYGAQADGFMRLNIGCARSMLQEGLEQLKKLYDAYFG